MVHVDRNPDDFGDWSALEGLIRTAFEPEMGRVDPPPSGAIVTAAELRTKALNELFFVVQNPLCACVFARESSDALYVGKLAVAPIAQGKGLGRALIGAVEKRGRELGLSKLNLEARLELVENHRFFKALGFDLVTASRHPGYSRPTSLLFEKRLSPVSSF